MTEAYVPIRSAMQLEQLHDDEIVEGYRDGFKNEPEPQGNRSLSYWHGWRNGMVDASHRKLDAAQAQLADDYVATLRNRRADKQIAGE